MINAKSLSDAVNKKRAENIELYPIRTYTEINENVRPVTNGSENGYESIDLNLPDPPDDLQETNRYELDEIEILLIQALVLLCTILALLLFFFVVYNVLEDRSSTQQFYKKYPILRKNFTNIMQNVVKSTIKTNQ